MVAATEHPSVLEPVRRLARRGHRTVVIPVDQVGTVRPEDIEALLKPAVTLVSVMYANNEIGTIQPIARIAQVISRWRRAHRTRYPLFHVDACQATTTLDMDVQRLGADLLTLNGTKAYGPHGTAVLYVRRGVPLDARVFGGSQEGGRRAGTEDVAGASGLAAALKTVRPSSAGRMRALRDRLIAGIVRSVPDARLNGPVGNGRLAGNVNISIPGCDSENLLLELDRTGIRAGSGSACTAQSVAPSHVLVAIGTPRRYLDGVLRFSLGRDTTRAQIDAVIRALPAIVAMVRARRHRSVRTA
jgi:cysteine desulfurase